MKKNILYIAVCLIGGVSYSQSALNNTGDLTLHSGANIGFHTNLINSGNITANDNTKAVFHSDSEDLTVSGTSRAEFYNVDLETSNANLELETSLGVTNEFNFIEGYVTTPKTKDETDASLDFIGATVSYVGEGDENHVNGYAAAENYNGEFIFPIGNGDLMRPMIIPNLSGSTTFKGAYYGENPNELNSFSEGFDKNAKAGNVKQVSKSEFWDLNGDSQTNVTLTWDNLSGVDKLTTDMGYLQVVGWSKANNKWEDLGNEEVTGDFDSGKITSKKFNPNDYEVITIGSNEDLNLRNYLISPNGDGVGETLTIKTTTEDFSTSQIEIYNRWSTLVYKSEGTKYNNDWNGFSSESGTLSKEKQLPAGTYFYVLKYGKNLDQTIKGWVQIER